MCVCVIVSCAGLRLQRECGRAVVRACGRCWVPPTCGREARAQMYTQYLVKSKWPTEPGVKYKMWNKSTCMQTCTRTSRARMVRARLSSTRCCSTHVNLIHIGYAIGFGWQMHLHVHDCTVCRWWATYGCCLMLATCLLAGCCCRVPSASVHRKNVPNWHHHSGPKYMFILLLCAWCLVGSLTRPPPSNSHVPNELRDKQTALPSFCHIVHLVCGGWYATRSHDILHDRNEAACERSNTECKKNEWQERERESES